MFIGNIVCAVVNLPLAKVLVRVLSVPARILFPLVLGLAFIGTYAINNMTSDLLILVAFGLIGLFLEKADIPTTPLILGAIVGNTMEQSFRQARIISSGHWNIFWSSPLAIVLILMTVAAVAWPLIRDIRKNRVAAQT